MRYLQLCVRRPFFGAPKGASGRTAGLGQTKLSGVFLSIRPLSWCFCALCRLSLGCIFRICRVRHVYSSLQCCYGPSFGRVPPHPLKSRRQTPLSAGHRNWGNDCSGGCSVPSAPHLFASVPCAAPPLCTGKLYSELRRRRPAALLAAAAAFQRQARCASVYRRAVLKSSMASVTSHHRAVGPPCPHQAPYSCL